MSCWYEITYLVCHDTTCQWVTSAIDWFCMS